MPLLVDIALPLPVEELFTYHVPAELEQIAEPGMRVVVEFRRDVLTGVIVDVYSDTDRPVEFKTKPVREFPDPEPVFDRPMLELTRWVAEYYLASWGETLKTALPQGIEQKSRWVVRPAAESPHAVAEKLAETAPVQSRLMKIIADSGVVTLGRLRQVYGRTEFRSTLRVLEEKGYVNIVDEQAGPAAKVYTEKAVSLLVPGYAESGVKFTEKQTRLLDGLRGAAEPVPLALIIRAWGISRDTVKRLEKRNLVRIEEIEVIREPDVGEIEPETRFTLTDDQQTALDGILPRLQKREFSTVLCHGVTGSGKTRVYMDAIEYVVNDGGGAIVLVPEISLTPQTVSRFKSRFGDQVAVLHSQLSVGERYDSWRQLRSGKKRLAVGPRSAVFAPVQDLRLIVVDEEHDASYKQEEHDPRYNARDVAVVRAQKSNAVVILGSATPSMESLHNTRQGKYARVDLPRRIDSRPMPKVHIVNMTDERESKNFSALSRPLRNAIAQRLEREEQVVILQNRRGFSSTVECTECGYMFECRNCTISSTEPVSMTYHQADELLKCHYCGNHMRVPERCPNCDESAWHYGGFGTQRVQDHIEKAFPGVALIRMDQDTTRRRNSHFRLLEQFRRREASILLGTQMVSKGLDFPDVTLVGVIAADIGLNRNDFRAGERVFQLLTQVAGRTGRGERKGEVFIQTYDPEHPAVVHAQSHDVVGYGDYELVQREMLGWPPFGRVVLLRFRGQNNDKTADAAVHLASVARDLVKGTDIEVQGPNEAPIPRVRKFWRWQVFLKGMNGRSLRLLARELTSRFGRMKTWRGVQLTIDVDPVGMM